MFEDPLEIAGKQYLTDPSLYNWLVWHCIHTWQKLGFVAGNAKVRLYEVTLTQFFLFDIWQLAQTHQMPVYLLESRDERRTGADIEIFVETALGFVYLPTQAKLLKCTNKYETMRHGPKGKAQIDLLLHHANQTDGLPLYLLYNHCTDNDMIIELMSARNIPFQHFGMSVVSA